MLSPDGRAQEAPRDFAKRIQLPIADTRLLIRALTRRSYLNEHPEALEDNERLEFLGDAVLDFVVGGWLYNHFPEKSEGEMTRLRAALVRTETLGEFGAQLGLGNALRLGRGEEEGGGRHRPAMLCATFEALVGALYLDAGLEAVQGFIDPIVEEAVVAITNGEGDRDPKSQLQEWVQARGHEAPLYRIAAESGPDHDKFFEVEVVVGGAVIARGTGKNKQVASKAAARLALHKLSQQTEKLGK